MERVRRVDSWERWELTAFITAFSPCHGFSLRHSLQAIERQAILPPFRTRYVIYIALIRLRELPAPTSDWIM